MGSSSGSGSPGSFDSMAFLQQLTTISTGPNLTISSINATQDGGMYTCVVVNQAGQDSANVTLYVRPLIVDQPQDQFTRQGETVTLSCRADSFPSPLYQWEKFNTTSESYYQLPGETNRTLEFRSVEEALVTIIVWLLVLWLVYNEWSHIQCHISTVLSSLIDHHTRVHAAILSGIDG